MQPNRLSVGLLAALLALVACGGGGGGGGGGTDQQQQLVPSSTDLAPGEAVRFSLATSPDEAVTWVVEEPEGGSVDASGVYTAPAVEGIFHVVAIQQGGSHRAEVNVKKADPSGVKVTPPQAELAAGETVSFGASVAGDSAAAVTWSVEEGAAGGAVTATGDYTAPATGGTYHVVATSVRAPTLSARATVVVTAAAPPPASNTGTGTTAGPSYVSVTGGGAMPSLSGAPVASCKGDGNTDDTACLQAALDGAAQAGKPLALPATSASYRITAPLRVATSIIGTGGMPTIRQTSACATKECVGLRLMPNMTGWIYNLHVVGAYTTSRGEFAHNINVGGVNGVTIKGNLLENAIGDAIADNAQELDGSATARNVLIDGNTMIHTARCMISIVNVADRWAIMNNVMQDTAPWVSPIDLEPWQAASYVSNVEVGYNKITTPANPTETQAGNYVGVVTASGWVDPSPGQNVFAHHNYGSWPFAKFVNNTSNAGSFVNVMDANNVQGDAVPRG